MSKLAKIAAAFPRTRGHRDVQDPWGMGFRVRVRRNDNADWKEWAKKILNTTEFKEAMAKAQLRVSAQHRDWRRAQTREEAQEALIENFRLDSDNELVGLEEQAPGIRQHLIARDAEGPLVWLDGERFTDGELEDITTVRYGDEREPLRWMPETNDDGTPRLFGGQPFELAFLQWVSQESSDLAAFEERVTEDDLGNSDGGRGGGTASTSKPLSESSTDAGSSSTMESGGAVSGAA